MLNSLAAVIHKNKRNAGGNSEEIVHPPELLEGWAFSDFLTKSMAVNHSFRGLNAFPGSMSSDDRTRS